MTPPTAEAEAIATAAAEVAPPPPMPDPQEECVLCCYHLPLKPKETTYKECCGQLICRGCIIAEQRTQMIGTNVKKPIAGSKEEELEFIKILTIFSPEDRRVCPFCNAQNVFADDPEFLKRLHTRIDKYKDSEAMNMLGGRYKDGSHGLSKDLKKAEELYQRSYYLGNPEAAYMLSELYSEHIPDQARMMKYVEEGIRRGDARCIFKKAGCALKSGNFKEATRRWMTVARLGEDAAIHNLMVFHRKKLLSKDDLTTALRAHKTANDNVKSEPREYAIRCDAFREKNLSDRERVTARIVVSS